MNPFTGIVVHNFCIILSPGRSWAAASTEGVLVYSLDHKLHFDPFELQVDITPESVRKTLGKGDYSSALMMSFRLNEQNLIEEVLEKIPYTQSEFFFFFFLIKLLSLFYLI